jgi:hypothetical protein
MGFPVFFNVRMRLHGRNRNRNRNTNIELLNRLSNKHEIVTENMHDSTYNAARHI